MLYANIVKLGRRYGIAYLALLLMLFGSIAFLPTGVHAHSSSNSPYSLPTWWAKYQALLKRTTGSASKTNALSVGANVDVSNEDTPQSETSITVNPNNPDMLVGGSNEIFPLPIRRYFSNNSGHTSHTSDLPLPPT